MTGFNTAARTAYAGMTSITFGGWGFTTIMVFTTPPLGD